jgi:transposase
VTARGRGSAERANLSQGDLNEILRLRNRTQPASRAKRRQQKIQIEADATVAPDKTKLRGAQHRGGGFGATSSPRCCRARAIQNCTMAPVPSEEEEDLREAGRRRETLVHARLRVENQIVSLLIRQGIKGFKPRLKNAETKLGELRTFDGRPLPVNMMNSLRLLLAQHRLLSAQLKAIEEARQRVVTIADPDRLQRMIQALAGVVGVGVETATVLVHEVFSRSFKDRRAVGAFVGLTGTPYNSGGSKTEQGISKNGNARVRRMLSQLAWRWLGHQPDSVLAQWFKARLGGGKGRMKKVLIVALMRKLVIALWRLAETGEVPAGARLAAR